MAVDVKVKRECEGFIGFVGFGGFDGFIGFVGFVGFGEDERVWGLATTVSVTNFLIKARKRRWIMNFEKYAEKGNRFIKELARELGCPDDKKKAGRVLKAVLKALRNRLSHEESMHLLAQLPMCIKAVYVDGWKLSRTPQKIKDVSEFVDEVMRYDAARAQQDFETKDEAIKAIKAVFHVIKGHISDGEAQDIEAELPKRLKELWEDA